MKIPRQKIPADKRHELLQVYLNLGHVAARPLCIEYGVSQDYAAKHAFELGIQADRARQNHSDPRWARAIAIGAIVA